MRSIPEDRDVSISDLYPMLSTRDSSLSISSRRAVLELRLNRKKIALNLVAGSGLSAHMRLLGLRTFMAPAVTGCLLVLSPYGWAQ